MHARGVFQGVSTFFNMLCCARVRLWPHRRVTASKCPLRGVTCLRRRDTSPPKSAYREARGLFTLLHVKRFLYRGFARQPCWMVGTIDSFSHGNKCSF